MYAARAIAAGERDVMVAGGTESMSGYPVSVESSNKLRERLKSRGKEVLAYKRKFRLGDLKDIGDDVGFVNTLWAGLSDPITEVTMPATAEKLARKYELTREELDEFAMLSHRRAERSTKDGLFCREIVPVKGLAYDECIRSPDPKAYREAKRIPGAAGTGIETDLITPLNACPINDGAGAVLVMSERTARERGLPIMGYVTAYASEACDPAIMGIGPAYAIRTLLQRHEVRTGRKLTLDDIAQVEINEAFAAVALANAKELGLPIEKVNPRGGAIALGHPVGATGARNAATALYSMMANGYERAIVSACVGGGQGVAYLLERPDNAKTLGR
jgi:acetyl-CoA acetyltransferase family protein